MSPVVREIKKVVLIILALPRLMRRITKVVVIILAFLYLLALVVYIHPQLTIYSDGGGLIGGCFSSCENSIELHCRNDEFLCGIPGSCESCINLCVGDYSNSCE